MVSGGVPGSGVKQAGSGRTKQKKFDLIADLPLRLV